MKRSWLLAAFIFVGAAQAQQLTIPNEFSAGTPAVADEVNDNFAAVEASVNDNTQDIEALSAAQVGIDFEASETWLRFEETAPTPTVVSSVTVTAPGPGYIKVDFNSQLVVYHYGSNTSVVTCALKNDDTGSPDSETNRLFGSRRFLRIPFELETGQKYLTSNTVGIHTVGAAGSVTFNLVCTKLGPGWAEMRERTLAATYYSAAY